MGQASIKLRNCDHGPGQSGFVHYCPGCDEMHYIQTVSETGPRWTFDGNMERPTFGPSVRIRWSGYDKVDECGIGIGDKREFCCHYFLQDGEIRYCGDSTHALAGQKVPLPDLPSYLRDEI